MALYSVQHPDKAQHDLNGIPLAFVHKSPLPESDGRLQAKFLRAAPHRLAVLGGHQRANAAPSAAVAALHPISQRIHGLISELTSPISAAPANFDRAIHDSNLPFRPLLCASWHVHGSLPGAAAAMTTAAPRARPDTPAQGAARVEHAPRNRDGIQRPTAACVAAERSAAARPRCRSTATTGGAWTRGPSGLVGPAVGQGHGVPDPQGAVPAAARRQGPGHAGAHRGAAAAAHQPQRRRPAALRPSSPSSSASSCRTGTARSRPTRPLWPRSSRSLPTARARWSSDCARWTWKACLFDELPELLDRHVRGQSQPLRVLLAFALLAHSSRLPPRPLLPLAYRTAP